MKCWWLCLATSLARRTVVRDASFPETLQEVNLDGMRDRSVGETHLDDWPEETTSLLAGASSGLLEEAAGLGSEAREPVDVLEGVDDFRTKKWKPLLMESKEPLNAGAFGTVFAVRAKCPDTFQDAVLGCVKGCSDVLFADKIQRCNHEGRSSAGYKNWRTRVEEEVRMLRTFRSSKFVRIIDARFGPVSSDKHWRHSILMEMAAGDLTEWTTWPR